VEIVGINPLISTASPRYTIQEGYYNSRDRKAGKTKTRFLKIMGKGSYFST
jgi:hypothetical protein